ncbi:DUF5050 domain-containing protein [Clostridium thermarum]|uniref:DUF5050 domain-containing protein n=1 Tax=Clostridium thermarum TaxID=1716543 RepID=UPI001FAB1CDF|nr:DUF5050 domain-containing protein [Clostridium thermarum]
MSQLDAATALREIYNEQVSYINIVGEWVYFINNKGYICKIKQTGENFTIVKSGRFYNLLVYDNNLYFMEDTKIMTVPLQSPNEMRQITSGAYTYTISDDGKSLFYMEQDLDPLKRNFYQVTLTDFSKKLFFNSEDKYSITGMHTYNDYKFKES